jgi:hypothetical protein
MLPRVFYNRMLLARMEMAIIWIVGSKNFLDNDTKWRCRKAFGHEKRA